MEISANKRMKKENELDICASFRKCMLKHFTLILKSAKKIVCILAVHSCAINFIYFLMSPVLNTGSDLVYTFMGCLD